MCMRGCRYVCVCACMHMHTCVVGAYGVCMYRCVCVCEQICVNMSVYVFMISYIGVFCCCARFMEHVPNVAYDHE